MRGGRGFVERDNFHLARLWRLAETALREAKRILFIGYSLPGDDLHIKYLFKRGISTRSSSNRPQIVVVDQAPEAKSHVADRYRRFFGDIEYCGGGFDKFARRREPHPVLSGTRRRKA